MEIYPKTGPPKTAALAQQKNSKMLLKYEVL